MAVYVHYVKVNERLLIQEYVQASIYDSCQHFIVDNYLKFCLFIVVVFVCVIIRDIFFQVSLPLYWICS